jgi:hypothetical protein
MEAIPLASLLGSGIDPRQCKLHCAVYNKFDYPIDVLSNDWPEWLNWNRYRGDNNDFNRQFIFSLAHDRHDPTLWLFGGVFEVLARRDTPRTYSYDIELREDLMGPFVRRLYVRLELSGRQRRRNMESCIDAMTVDSIVPKHLSATRSPAMTASTTRWLTSNSWSDRAGPTGGSRWRT